MHRWMASTTFTPQDRPKVLPGRFLLTAVHGHDDGTVVRDVAKLTPRRDHQSVSREEIPEVSPIVAPQQRFEAVLHLAVRDDTTAPSYLLDRVRLHNAPGAVHASYPSFLLGPGRLDRAGSEPRQAGVERGQVGVAGAHLDVPARSEPHPATGPTRLHHDPRPTRLSQRAIIVPDCPRAGNGLRGESKNDGVKLPRRAGQSLDDFRSKSVLQDRLVGPQRLPIALEQPYALIRNLPQRLQPLQGSRRWIQHDVAAVQIDPFVGRAQHEAKGVEAIPERGRVFLPRFDEAEEAHGEARGGPTESGAIARSEAERLPDGGGGRVGVDAAHLPPGYLVGGQGA
mmetsp:Transcript_20827/g.48904  ORF Transcript_20827/g.48904 Transcript_20827/m.48904 type:complete len:340 (-) Transcript_20827:631-1650(-)